MVRALATMLLMVAACAARAGEPAAYGGIAADAASTAAALSAPGVTEANPLGWATLPLRVVMVEHAKTLPREQAQPVFDAAQASGWGAAANNVFVLMGAGAAAPLVGIAVGYFVWTAGEKEREFWRLCGLYRSKAPEMRCNFSAWRKEDVIRVAVEPREASR